MLNVFPAIFFFCCLLSAIIGYTVFSQGKMSVSIIKKISISFAILEMFAILLATLSSMYFEPSVIDLGKWLDFNSYNVHWRFIIDSSTTSICALLAMIMMVVNLFLFKAVKHEKIAKSFFLHSSVVMLTIGWVVFSENILAMNVGWMALSVISYFIFSEGFSTETKEAKQRIFLASLLLADIVFFIGSLGLVSLFSKSSLLDLFSLFGNVDLMTSGLITCLCGMVALGLVLKQMVFFMFLKDKDQHREDVVLILFYNVLMLVLNVFVMAKLAKMFKIDDLVSSVQQVVFLLGCVIALIYSLMKGNIFNMVLGVMMALWSFVLYVCSVGLAKTALYILYPSSLVLLIIIILANCFVEHQDDFAYQSIMQNISKLNNLVIFTVVVVGISLFLPLFSGVFGHVEVLQMLGEENWYVPYSQLLLYLVTVFLCAIVFFRSVFQSIYCKASSKGQMPLKTFDKALLIFLDMGLLILHVANIPLEIGHSFSRLYLGFFNGPILQNNSTPQFSSVSILQLMVAVFVFVGIAVAYLIYCRNRDKAINSRIADFSRSVLRFLSYVGCKKSTCTYLLGTLVKTFTGIYSVIEKVFIKNVSIMTQNCLIKVSVIFGKGQFSGLQEQILVGLIVVLGLMLLVFKTYYF